MTMRVQSWNRQWLAWVFMLALVLGGCVTMSLQDEIAGLMKEGEQLYHEKKFDAALDRFASVITKDPQYWRAYVWAARSFIAQGKWKDALAQARKAIEKSPKDADTLAVMADALFGGGVDALKNGHTKEAISLFSEFLKLEPADAKAWLKVGKAYWDAGEIRKSLEQFREALRLDPNNAEAQRFLGGR